MNLLPSASSVVNLADSQDRAAFATLMKIKEEPMDVESVDSNKEEVDFLVLYKSSFSFSSPFKIQTNLKTVEYLKSSAFVLSKILNKNWKEFVICSL